MQPPVDSVACNKDNLLRVRPHQQEFHFAPGAPGASEAPGAPSANRNSGCVVAYSFRPDAYPPRPGAPDAPGCQPPASSIFSQPLTFVDVLSCLLSSSRTLLILAPLRLVSASSPPHIPFSLRIRPQSATFPDTIHLPPIPFNYIAISHRPDTFFFPSLIHPAHLWDIQPLPDAFNRAARSSSLCRYLPK